MRDMTVADSFTASVRNSIASAGAQITDMDAVGVNLALHYAAELDRGGDLAKLGPALLTALVQLGLTPKARASAVGRDGKVDDGGSAARSPLDELRARRAARLTAPA